MIRLLLIDDDQEYNTLIKHMLNQSSTNFEIEWVPGYKDGLQAMLAGQHDVYLVDYRLGNQSGLDLLRRAIDSGVTAPIIMITGRDDPDIDMKSLHAGAADYIEKSELQPKTLQRSIRHALERNQITSDLRASEERYRSLLREAFDGILIVDGTGEINFVNERICEMLEYGDRQLREMNFSDLLQSPEAFSLPKDDRGTIAEQKFKKKDGSFLDVEISAKRIHENEVQLIARDITDRKQSLNERDEYIERLTILRQIDDELSQILNIDYVLSLALDATVRLSGANAGYIGLLDEGRLRLAQAIGYYSTAIAEDYIPENPLIKRLTNNMTPMLIQDVEQEPEYEASNPDAKAKMMLPLLSYERMVGILNLETNRPERFTEETFEFLKLITARVAVAVENAQLYQISQDQLAKLQELYEQVSDLEKLKTDMIRMASHDLRNPVGVVMGYTALIKRFIEPDNTKALEYIQRIDNSAQRMEKIIGDILSLERIEKLVTDSDTKTNLNEIARETYNHLEEQAHLKSQTISLEISDDKLEVQGDSAQLREAIANLLSNAIKYTPEAGTITLSLVKEGNEAVLKVIDNGYGIQEDQQKSLFQAFYRATSRETLDIEGTGLGLYLIKNIIERYKGTIIFHSVYGKGSTFGFRLPLVQV